MIFSGHLYACSWRGMAFINLIKYPLKLNIAVRLFKIVIISHRYNISKRCIHTCIETGYTCRYGAAIGQNVGFTHK